MTVVVDDLNEWEDMWLECHREHTDPECADEVEEEETDADTHWGLLPDYDPASDEDGPLHLLKCCGTQRPRGKSIIVVVRPAIGSFVTIHDYLSTVHPLLLSSRADLLSAMGDVMENEPLASETRLIVDYHMPHHWLFASKMIGLERLADGRARFWRQRLPSKIFRIVGTKKD